MQKYRYYLPPQSKLPFAAGILSGLLCLDNIYTLISMPHYTQYWDYWATLTAALLLCVFCFLFRQRRTELTLIPAAILALIACITCSSGLELWVMSTASASSSSEISLLCEAFSLMRLLVRTSA